MKISVLGLWRDSTRTIQRTLNSLTNLTTLEDFDFSFYFYENDSVDDTSNILKEWLGDKVGQLYNEKLGAPKFGSVPDVNRLILLSYYRNRAKKLTNNISTDYTLLIDTDIIFDSNHFLQLYEAIIKTDTAMVVANTRQHQIRDLMTNTTQDSFYDVFALRDKYNNYGLYFTDCPLTLTEDRDLWENNKPVRIGSGFGGFSLIKTNVFKRDECIWSTCGHSEHINFCSSVSRYGDIFIIPECKPQTDIDISSINLQACEKIAVNQLSKLEQINQVYNLSVSDKLIK